MRYHINKIIQYLEGRLDIYNGEHDKTVQIWDSVWGEMLFMGLNPHSINDLKQYISEVTA